MKATLSFFVLKEINTIVGFDYNGIFFSMVFLNVRQPCLMIFSLQLIKISTFGYITLKTNLNIFHFVFGKSIIKKEHAHWVSEQYMYSHNHFLAPHEALLIIKLNIFFR